MDELTKLRRERNVLRQRLRRSRVDANRGGRKLLRLGVARDRRGRPSLAVRTRCGRRGLRVGRRVELRLRAVGEVESGAEPGEQLMDRRVV